MKKELDEQLVKDFPLLYTQRNWLKTQTCMCWGFPGDGWEPLIRELSEKLEPLIQKQKKEFGEHASAGQCKEKYGYMAFYLDGGTKEMYDIVRPYRSKSTTICQQCGKPSKIRNCYGWYVNCCDKCWVEYIKWRELKHDGYCEITEEDGTECENTSVTTVKDDKKIIFVCSHHYNKYYKKEENDN